MALRQDCEMYIGFGNLEQIWEIVKLKKLRTQEPADVNG